MPNSERYTALTIVLCPTIEIRETRKVWALDEAIEHSSMVRLVTLHQARGMAASIFSNRLKGRRARPEAIRDELKV